MNIPTLQPYRGHETILLVDDEQVVLNVARSILNYCGYNVLDYNDPIRALAVLDCPPCPVDLIVTDVIMPTLSGPELVRTAKQTYGDLSCVYMSGYAREQVAERGLDPLCDYLRKPFTPQELARRVRTVLDEKRR